MSKLAHTRQKIYNTIARQLHGQVPCWVCGQHVSLIDATLEHIQPLSDGGSSHQVNLAISHALCNQSRHAAKPQRKPAIQVGGAVLLSGLEHLDQAG
jgi:5-methylcytosine-specific restriction endonuclease McrA